MTTPDPNRNPYDPWSQPGPPSPSDQPGGHRYAGPSPYASGNSDPTVPPDGPSSLPTWPEQPDGSSYPQYGCGQVPPYPGVRSPGPQYPGQPQYPGAQYPGQPYPDPYPSGPYGAGYGWQFAYPADPLVPHPGGGFGAWWNSVWSAFGRSWKQLLPIVALTSALPGIILAILGVELLSRSFTVVDNGDIYTNPVTVHWGVFGAFVGLAVALGIVGLFAAAIGWSGAMWLVTRQAAGAPTSVGAALAFGARRCLRLGGLLVVVGLMVAVGLVACLLPGLYLAVAASLVVPFAIFDRGSSAIGGSFRLVNRNFGAVLGRLLIMYLLLSAVSGVINLIVSAIATGSTMTTAAGTGPSAGALVGEAVFSVIVSIPTTMFLIIGILMTYAQMRARAVPTSAHDLVNSLGV